MRVRIIDLVVSILASAGALLLSWPYWRDHQYWPESRLAWLAYFAIGLLLAAYVSYVFIGALRTLFEHDAIEHAEAAAAAAAAAGAATTGEDRP